MPADLTDVRHRPWPLPSNASVMEMTWENLLFAHWPVAAEDLRRLVPSRLEIDTFDGEAWIGVVPFTMSNVRVRPFPGIPGTTSFPEINVRTYVTEGGRPGVYFFSLDAASLMVVRAARAWYHLPYYHARMESWSEGETIHYQSARKSAGGTFSRAQFEGSFRPASPASCGECGPLAHWLTERYCLYSPGPRGRVYRADVHHSMWPLQRATAEICINTMTDPLGIKLPDTQPLLHFAKWLEVSAWRPCVLPVGNDHTSL